MSDQHLSVAAGLHVDSCALNTDKIIRSIPKRSKTGHEYVRGRTVWTRTTEAAFVTVLVCTRRRFTLETTVLCSSKLKLLP